MELQKALEKLGIATQSIQRLKLGQGVVGKLTTIATIAIFIMGALAFNLNNLYLTIGVVLLIFIFAIFTLRKIMKIACEHPDIALLEGAEFLIYHQKITLGSKGLPKPPKQEQLPQSDTTETTATSELENPE